MAASVVTGKTPFFVIGPFVLAILFVLTLASDGVVLYGNDAFSISVLSANKRYSSFSKKKFIFQKNVSKLKY